MLNRSKKKTATTNSDFIINGRETADSLSIANGFNSYFESVAQKLASKLPNTNDANHLVYLTNLNHENFTLNITTKQELLTTIQHMKNTAAGHDDVPVHVVKEIAPVIADVLVHIINISFITGIFPDRWKIAKVTPIFNRLDAGDCYNSRCANTRGPPVAVLADVAKFPVDRRPRAGG